MADQTSERLGFNIWTKNSPKPYIEDFAEFAKRQNLPIVAVVDDVLPEAVFNRTSSQTVEMNERYIQYMNDIGFESVSIVSEMIPHRDEDLFYVCQMSDRIAVSSFLGLLPERKRDAANNLRLSEAIDPCWQLHVMQAGMATQGITKYLTGKRSTALFRLAKTVIPDFEYQIID